MEIQSINWINNYLIKFGNYMLFNSSANYHQFFLKDWELYPLFNFFKIC